MAPLLTAREISKSFATRTLFTDVSLTIDEGDRLAVIGPNASGKSTLLRILARLEEADDGDIVRRKQLRMAYVAQDDCFTDGMTPHTAVVASLVEDDDAHLLDAETRAAITLSKLGFDGIEQAVETLSGGWRKRLSIACALAAEPDVLLLDEPTNHLDLEGVLWLEQFVERSRQAIVLITHDRMFLERVAKRIVELSQAYPHGTFEVKGNYSEFVRRKDAFLEAQVQQQNALANTVRRDTAWLRQGIQGRQTRNKTQVDDASTRRAELRAIRNRNDAPSRTASIDFQATERKTNKLLAAHALSKSLGGRLLFHGLDLTLSPGMRLGLLGPNGSGKTTLLRILASEMDPDTGTVKPAVDLRIVTFSQHRDALDPTLSLQESLCPTGDMVHYNDKPVHITGWARRFLFSADQLATPVASLSGGEQARALIATLMLQPADILLLDEPTNDLDIASLEVLERAIVEFPGAVVLITHDRFMLENVSTELLVLDGTGGFAQYASYAQLEAHRAASNQAKEPRRKVTRSPETADRPPSVPGPGKLSYKLQREFDQMEEQILNAETRVEDLQEQSVDPALSDDHVRQTEVFSRLAEAQRQVETLYARWAELEALRG